MASVIQKRLSLHRHLETGARQTQALQSQLCQLQPLANIGLVSSMIAHEINNLLTPLGNYAQLALQHMDDKALVEKALHKAALNAQRASKVMQSMLAMARGQRQDREWVCLKGLVEDVFQGLCRDFSKDRIQVRVEISSDLRIFAVAIQVQQVLMNLILNAREAMSSRGGTLSLRASQPQRGEVLIEVSDTGPGIDPEHLDKVFESFYSTKDPSQYSGTGLGLAFCKLVLDAHQGEIQVRSKLGDGTTFLITLPQPPVGNT